MGAKNSRSRSVVHPVDESATRLSVLAAMMLKMETNLQWSSVEAEWRTRRDFWVASVNSSLSMQIGLRSLGIYLLEFEQILKDTTVTPQWKQIRTEWMQEVERCAEVDGFGLCLLQLGENIACEEFRTMYVIKIFF